MDSILFTLLEQIKTEMFEIKNKLVLFRDEEKQLFTAQQKLITDMESLCNSQAKLLSEMLLVKNGQSELYKRVQENATDLIQVKQLSEKSTKDLQAINVVLTELNNQLIKVDCHIGTLENGTFLLKRSAN
ncbi:MAG: hypothetical protein WCI30_01550 [Clostridia bacterium]